MIENGYDEFIKLLYKHQDLKYKEFHKRLILSDNLIGVRTPILKKIAKQIARGNYNSFIELNKHDLYEETIIHGLILGYIKDNFNGVKELINNFLPYIDNWAICDISVSNLKIFNKNKEDGFIEIKKYLKNKNIWINRFGYVLLLNYYIDDEYIDQIFILCKNHKDEYYVKMSIAWLLSMCYIKYKEKTLKFLNSNTLDKWTYNKTIQKIIESNRINKDEKTILKGMKIK